MHNEELMSFPGGRIEKDVEHAVKQSKTNASRKPSFGLILAPFTLAKLPFLGFVCLPCMSSVYIACAEEKHDRRSSVGRALAF